MTYRVSAEECRRIRELSRAGRSRQEVADTLSRGTLTVIRHATGSCSHDASVVGDPDEPRTDPNNRRSQMLSSRLLNEVDPKDLGLSPLHGDAAESGGGRA